MSSPELPYDYPIIEFQGGTVSQKRAELLFKKLKEYRRRLNFARNQTTASIENLTMDAITSYKFVVLNRLFEEGRADPFSIRIELERQLGPQFHTGSFEHAWRVIDDYCKTGGANNTGGTGLEGNRRLTSLDSIPNSSLNPKDTIVYPVFPDNAGDIE